MPTMHPIYHYAGVAVLMLVAYFAIVAPILGARELDLSRTGRGLLPDRLPSATGRYKLRRHFDRLRPGISLC